MMAIDGGTPAYIVWHAGSTASTTVASPTDSSFWEHFRDFPVRTERVTPMLPKSWRWFDVFRERIEACVALLERAEAARRARALFHVSPAVRRRQKRKRQMQALRAQGV